jgi:ribose transport system substrate-binding protein
VISTNRRHRRMVMGFIAIAIALVFTVACGSNGSSNNNSGASSSAVASSVSAAGEAAYARYIQRPTDSALGTIPPITKPIPKGKLIIYIDCGVETCQALGDAAQQAASFLGWDFKRISTDGTPAGFQAGWDEAIRLKPAGIIYSGMQIPVIRSRIATAEAQGTLIAQCCTDFTKPGQYGITYTNWDASVYDAQGQALAALVAHDSGGTAQTMFMNIPIYASLTAIDSSFTAALPQYCAKCSVVTVNYGIENAANWSTQTVAYLRAHPDVKYIVFSADGAFVNVAPALLSAGLSDVKIVGQGPIVQNFSLIEQGQELGSVPIGYDETMFGAIDAFARKFAGVAPIPVVQQPVWVVTKDNLPSATQLFSLAPDTVELYEKAWRGQ